MGQCIAQAELRLSATPTPLPSATATVTLTPDPPTATVSPALPVPIATGIATGAATQAGAGPTANPTTAILQEFLARAQEAIRQNQYESAVAYLEAIREADKTFDANEVFNTLCSSYETLGRNYEASNQLSEMVVVINKALAMNCKLQDNNWSFTVDVVELYLSAKGYLDAGNYALADQVFLKLMNIDTGYLDSKTLACQAFSKAGDTSALQTYCK